MTDWSFQLRIHGVSEFWCSDVIIIIIYTSVYLFAFTPLLLRSWTVLLSFTVQSYSLFEKCLTSPFGSFVFKINKQKIRHHFLFPRLCRFSPILFYIYFHDVEPTLGILWGSGELWMYPFRVRLNFGRHKIQKTCCA